MSELHIQKFVKEHPNDWEEIITKAPYNLKVSRDGKYTLFKYDQVNSDFTLPIVKEARGIIFNEETWECVCHPFDKFFNESEPNAATIDWSTASVQTKVDGSLIKLFWHDGEWRVSTNGTIDARKAELNDCKYKSFYDLFMAAFPISFEKWDEFADRSCTYMFELVSPYNRVVIPYEETKLYFLGWRSLSSGQEFSPELSIAKNYFDIPERFPMTTVDEVVNAASKMSWDLEGFVVCDAKFNRVKIKSPAYVIAHYARSNGTITTERLIQIVLDREQDEFLVYASDYAEQLHEVEELMNKVAKTSVEQMRSIFKMEAKFANRGEYAREVSNSPGYMKDFLFHCFDEKIFYDYAKGWTASKWEKSINDYEKWRKVFKGD